MKRLIPVLLILILAVSCVRPELDINAIKEHILSAINRQEKAWNAHDIEGFMADYWNSEELTYQSGDKRLYGWQALLKRYKTNYAGEKMGKLTFSDIEVYVLNSDFAYALGRWKVEQDEEVKDGVYTIIFKRFPNGWKIIHDHSS